MKKTNHNLNIGMPGGMPQAVNVPTPKMAKSRKDNRPQNPNTGLQKAEKGGKTSPYGQPYTGNEVFNTKAFPGAALPRRRY